MDRHQGEEDEDDGGRRRQRLEATTARAARMRDNDPSKSEEDEPRSLSKKRKERPTSSEYSEEEFITLKGKPSALMKLLKGSTRSKKTRVRSETAAPVARDERVDDRVDERVGSQVPASSTVGELSDEELAVKELATLQQLMPLAGGIPRLDVLRALRVVDFNVVKAVMLLELVRQTHTLQDVVMDAFITDTLSEEQKALLERIIGFSNNHADRLDAFRALRVFGEMYCDVDVYGATSLLFLVYDLPSFKKLHRSLVESLEREDKEAVKQVVSLAGNCPDWRAMLAFSVCGYDVNKAAMLLALIQSQGLG